MKILLLIFLSLIPLSSFALIGNVETIGGSLAVSSDLIQVAKPSIILARIISYFIAGVAISGVIGITWGGTQMILSAGSEEKQKKGKFTMIFSVVGVILAGLAYGIVTIVGNLRI